jgi:starch-binding outer membrane protein, SusD/RagB family
MKTLLRSRLVLTTTTLALLGAITYACKDFLNTDAQGTLDQNALANRDGVEGSLIATYRMLDCNNVTSANWGCAASNWALSSITSDDAYKGSEDFDQPQATELELYAWDTDQGMDYLNAKWLIVYEGVVRANATLRLLAQIVAQKPAELTAAQASSIEGEALFLRAHYHFEAWRVWGNVPYYFEDDTDFRKANDQGIDGIGNLILADLDAAIAKLPAVPRDAGRASAWTAKAYKGRVLVYMHQYANAVTVLQDVKNNGPYDLETSFDHVWTGFPALQNGPETIFAFMASANDGEPNGQNSNWGERLNFPHSGSPFGCCGFHQPSQNLANAYRVDAVTGLPLAFTSPTTWNNRDAEWSASVADTVDPRMDWTIGRDDVPFKDWGLHSSLWIRSLSYGGPYSPKKNIHEKASPAQNHVGWQPEQTNAVHLHLYRYADLLLLLAESQVETNDLAGALANVNLVRARAGVTAQGCGSSDAATVAKYAQCAADSRLAVPINDASITWATYRVGLYPAFANQGQARLAVELERRLELAMEGQRLFDLRRYGGAIAQQTMADYLAKEATSLRRGYKTAQTPYTTPKYDLYPIPTVQIDLSKVGGQERLVQNPGW